MEGEPTIAAKYKMFLVILNNAIVDSEYKSQHILTIGLEGDAKLEHDNKWRTYRERITQLDKEHRQAFSMIRVQCMQFFLYNIKYDTYWDTTSESYNPLTLLKLIKKTILAQTGDQY